MTGRNKNRVLGLAIGFNIAAAISTLITGHSVTLTTHITLVIILITMRMKSWREERVFSRWVCAFRRRFRVKGGFRRNSPSNYGPWGPLENFLPSGLRGPRVCVVRVKKCQAQVLVFLYYILFKKKTWYLDGNKLHPIRRIQ